MRIGVKESLLSWKFDRIGAAWLVPGWAGSPLWSPYRIGDQVLGSGNKKFSGIKSIAEKK